MFIDKTYFEGEIYLPTNNRQARAGFGNLTQSSSEGNLDWYISNYEDEYLKKLLGIIYPVYMDEMISDIYSERAQQLYKMIYQTKLVWGGTNEQGLPTKKTVPYSPAAYYIYYNYMRNNRSQTSMKGEVRANIFEAQNLSSSASQKLSDLWNVMAEESTNIQHWIIKSRMWDDVLKTHVPHANHAHWSCHGIHFMGSRFRFYHFAKINAFSI